MGGGELVEHDVREFPAHFCQPHGFPAFPFMRGRDLAGIPVKSISYRPDGALLTSRNGLQVDFTLRGPQLGLALGGKGGRIPLAFNLNMHPSPAFYFFKRCHFLKGEFRGNFFRKFKIMGLNPPTGAQKTKPFHSVRMKRLEKMVPRKGHVARVKDSYFGGILGGFLKITAAPTP